MSYGAKYKFKFEDIHGVTYEVRLLEDSYYGDPTVRPLGAAPVIRMQESGAFRTTSCELTLECQVDGEFADLYTSDPLQYKIVVYRGVELVWQGFVATEIYSEPDIAPPYDVKVTATDGLGVLKEYDFVPAGLQTVRKHLEDLISWTGIDNVIYCATSLCRHGDTVPNFFDEVLISLDYHTGDSVYDALEDLLRTMRCFVTQWSGKWLVIRETDVTVNSGNSKVPMYVLPVTPSTPTYSADITYLAASVGQMGVEQLWPVGFLTRTIRPAKKSVKVKSEWHLKSAAPPTTDDSSDGWTGMSDYGHSSGYPTWTLGNLGGTGGMYATIPMANYLDDVKVTVKVAHNQTWTNWNGKPYVKITAQYSDASNTYYYDPENGWTTTGPAQGNEVSVEKTNRSNDPNGWDEVSATLPSANKSQDVQLVVIVTGHLVTVADVSVELGTVKGYEDTILIDNGARGAAPDLSVSGGREVAGYIIRQEWVDGVFVRSGYQTIIQSFDDADNTDLDYLSLTALNYAKEHAAPRIEITGTIDFPSIRPIQPIIIKSHGVWALMESYDWNLKEAEINFKAVTLPSATLTVDSETITSLPN